MVISVHSNEHSLVSCNKIPSEDQLSDEMLRRYLAIGKSHEFCGSHHCFSYYSWPPDQQKSRLLIGLNCTLLGLKNNSQIAKKLLQSCCRLEGSTMFCDTLYFDRLQLKNHERDGVKVYTSRKLSSIPVKKCFKSISMGVLKIFGIKVWYFTKL